MTIIIDKINLKHKLVPMNMMQPMQIGMLVDGNNKDTVVMRTLNSDKFEVMNLSEPGVDVCWNTHCTLPVRLLEKGESVNIRISND